LEWLGQSGLPEDEGPSLDISIEGTKPTLQEIRQACESNIECVGFAYCPADHRWLAKKAGVFVAATTDYSQKYAGETWEWHYIKSRAQVKDLDVAVASFMDEETQRQLNTKQQPLSGDADTGVDPTPMPPRLSVGSLAAESSNEAAASVPNATDGTKVSSDAASPAPQRQKKHSSIVSDVFAPDNNDSSLRSTPDSPSAGRLGSFVGGEVIEKENADSPQRRDNVESFMVLNQLIYSRSKRAQLVVMNLPDLWGTEPEEVRKFMSYCDTLTKGLDRVLFVHSSGHEIFDISI